MTVGYGLRNLASWERGLEEMARVARPGGRLLVLDFGKPENKVWRSGLLRVPEIPCAALRENLLQRCGDLRLHFRIVARLPAQRGVAAKMEALHCQDVQARHLLGGAMSIHFGRVRKEC